MKKVEITPAGPNKGQGWWIIVLRDGLENRWPVTWEELKEIYAELKDLKMDKFVS